MNTDKRKLTDNQVQRLIAEYSSTKDVKVKEKIVLQYKNLVESIARRFAGSGEPLEDLVQEGYIGLVTAADLYDSDKGVKFSTYATHFIIGQIKHSLRDRGKIIKEPAWLQELNHRMTRVIDSLYQELNRVPTEAEIAQIMHVPEEMVVELLTTREVFKVASLDSEQDDSSQSSGPEVDRVKDDKCDMFQLPVEDKIVLETAVNKLKIIEQKVIQEFYYTGLTQTEIAKKLGISCNYVSHILRSGTKKLRRILTTEELMEVQMQLQLASRRAEAIAAEVDATVIDNLTGLYNRSYMEERLQEELTRAARGKEEVAFAMVSITGLEEIGRKLGTMRRDDAICEFGRMLRDNVRRCDIVGRMDEWEFALILNHTGAQASVVCERVGKAMRKLYLDIGVLSAEFECRMAFSVYPADASGAREMIDIARARTASIDPFPWEEAA
jgi:RNA polymerase sigma-B factor